MHNDVLPFYQEHTIEVAATLTDKGRELCGTERHPYELYLQLNDIEHRTTHVRRPQTNGFVECFNRTVLDEFFRTAFRTKFYETVEKLQADLDQRLVYYNTERPHHGYLNLGKRPIDTVEQYLNACVALDHAVSDALESSRPAEALGPALAASAAATT